MRIAKSVLSCAVAVAVLVVSGCTSQASSVVTPQSTALSLPLRKAGPPDIYPNVPGKKNAGVRQENIRETICASGWTARIRPPASYTTALKKKQLLAEHNPDQALGDFEEDHLISLELGGNPTDPKNLWPEPYSASIPDGGARSKDRVETALKKAVCNGSMTLAEAQHIITTDWYAYYKNNIAGNAMPMYAATDADDPDDM